MIADSNFSSGGLQCAGTLYLPEGATESPPVVVMGHGLGALKEFRIPAFAERFNQRGLAVFAFDYRHWGGSAGEPRQFLDPQRQLQDWQAALAHVRSLDSVDGERLGIWGSSFGGAHVIHLAAQDRAVRAVVAQVPAADTASSAGSFRLSLLLQLVWYGLLDALGAVFRAPPRYVPLVGHPGEVAVLSTGECWDGYMGLVPEGSPWENRMTARSFLKLPKYRAVKVAARVQAPVLLQAGIHDSLVALEDVRKLAGELPRATLKEYDCNHFEPYYDAMFERFAATQAAFLAEHLSL